MVLIINCIDFRGPFSIADFSIIRRNPKVFKQLPDLVETFGLIGDRLLHCLYCRKNFCMLLDGNIPGIRDLFEDPYQPLLHVRCPAQGPIFLYYFGVAPLSPAICIFVSMRSRREKNLSIASYNALLVIGLLM